MDPTAILNLEAGHDYMALKSELDLIHKAQSEDLGEPSPGQTLDTYHATVQTRCRRAIEIIAIIRRANTGPAKAKGRSSKKSHDMAKVRSALLE